MADIPVECGPRDLRQLPEYFGHKSEDGEYGSWDIEILAEISHAPRHTVKEILRQAKQLADDGADVIDLVCDPREKWPGVAKAVRGSARKGFACRSAVSIPWKSLRRSVRARNWFSR